MLALRPYSLGFAEMPVLEGLAFAEACGFASVELNAFTAHDLRTDAVRRDGFFFDRMSRGERERLRTALRPFHRVTLHAPCDDLLFFSENRRIRAMSRHQIETAFEAAAYLGAELVTIHPHRKTGMIEEDALPNMVERYRAFGEAAAARGLRLALENTRFPFKLSQLVGLADGACGPHVGMALNPARVWHLTPGDGDPRRRLNDAIAEVLSALGNRVTHVYLADTAGGAHADPVAPGEGLVDFGRLGERLRAAGYAGLGVVQMPRVAGESPDVCRARVRSARELLAGLPPWRQAP